MTPIQSLRQIMCENGIAACILPSADPHLSEYLPEHWKARKHFSGFTGSAGTFVLTQDVAAVWTDSRYWQQAEQQLANSEVILKKQGIDPEITDYLLATLPEGSTVVVAADMISVAQQKRFQAAFSSKNIILNTETAFLNQAWASRPALPDAPVFAHKTEFVGENVAAKLARIREVMRQKGAQHHLISSLDDIAWVSNLRGSDIPYNPVFLSYLLIGEQDARLFVHAAKLSDEHRAMLQAAQIHLADYGDIVAHLAQLSGSLLLDENKTAVATLSQLNQNVHIIHDVNPSTLFKSQKTAQEIAHLRETMREDGAAMCDFFAELERDLAAGARICEWDIAARLTHHRSQRPHYISPSFNTIAGFQANGALPHYAAPETDSALIAGDGLLLIDSGAQYHGGTTDITRVMGVGAVSEAAKTDFTLVLKANIALSCAVFPEQISAATVDAIARAPLWQTLRDYGHGTGHGIGYCLNVHEFPATIAYRAQHNPHNILRVGQVVSNEPALYREGEYGIRIENVLVCCEQGESAFGAFLAFETLTLCPIDTRLIIKDLLSENELNWLNDYHARVWAALSPLVAPSTQAWLAARTRAI